MHNTQYVRVRCRGAFLCGLLCLFSGCGGQQADYAKLGLVEISGKVTLDGDPIAGAAVYFYDENDSYCFGMTDTYGNYTMMLNSEKSGVTPGKKLVKISTRSNPLGEAAESLSDGEDAEVDPDATAAGPAEQIPACYNSESSIEVNISSADSSFDFELTSDCSAVSPI